MSTIAEPGANTLSAGLPGTWELVSRTDVTALGEPRVDQALGADPVAILFYDRTGHFGAQFMKRDRSGPVVDAPAGALNNTRAQGGYDAYFGTYAVDDAAGTVTQRLVGALSPGNAGQVVTRTMVVEGDCLTIRLQTTSSDQESLIRTLIWKRVG
jgi:hypothetical protein